MRGRGRAGGSTVSLGRAAGAAGTVATASTASTLPRARREEWGSMCCCGCWLQRWPTVVRRAAVGCWLQVATVCSMCCYGCWLLVAVVTVAMRDTVGETWRRAKCRECDHEFEKWCVLSVYI